MLITLGLFDENSVPNSVQINISIACMKYSSSLTLPKQIFLNKEIFFAAKVSNASGSSEYQVKWEGLPYSASTWEYSSLISRLFPKKIAEFDIRQNNTNVPTKDSKV